MVGFRFQAHAALADRCRAYHAWRRRGSSARAQADADLTIRVSAIHAHSHGTYGAPRIHAETVVSHETLT